jgi:hypothetical protein
VGESAITRGTFLEDLVREYPSLVVPLTDKGVLCMKCGTVSWDTIEEAARRAGIEDVDALVGELRELARAGTASGQ